VTSHETSKEVFAILAERTHGMTLDESLLLGSGGLGLDSISLVEVLLECEERFGVTIAPELLEQSPLTVGALVERIDALLAS
jgi:acyl carrier protein